MSRIGNVILHASIGVNVQLRIADRTTKTVIDLGSKTSVVTIGVVDVMLMAIYTKAVFGDVELSSGKSEFHEAKNRDDAAKYRLVSHLQALDVQQLGIVAQPIAEVDLAGLHLGESVVGSVADRKNRKYLLDIAMAPDVAIPGTAVRNLTGAESERRRSKEAEASNKKKS